MYHVCQLLGDSDFGSNTPQTSPAGVAHQGAIGTANSEDRFKFSFQQQQSRDATAAEKEQFQACSLITYFFTV